MKNLTIYPKISTLCFLLAYLYSCGNSNNEVPPSPLSKEAKILKMVIEVDGTTYEGEIKENDITFVLPSATTNSSTIKVLDLSSKASAKMGNTVLTVNKKLPALTSGNIKITVTAEDGTSKIYTIKTSVLQQASDKQLTALTLTINNNDYVAAIDETAKTATFSVPAADAGATTSIVKIITTSTAATASVSTTANLPLTNNGATITITAEDGSQQAYTLVIKSISSDKQLTALTLTINNNDYVAAIDETAKTATFSVPAADAGATTSIVKIITTSTAATASVSTTANLPLTNNSATVTITAEDASEQAYTLVIKSISSDKQLTALTLTINNNDYVAAIDETAKTATFSVPAADAGATTSIVKIITTSTAATASVSTTANLPLTNNGATITITAEDGSQQAYTLVIKSISSDKQLTALTLTINNNDYVAAIDETAKTATFSVPAADAGATTSIVKIITTSTAATASVSTTANLPLTNNGATITITAEDGSQQAYTVVITAQQQQPSDKQLTALTLTINNNDYVAAIDETAKTATFSVPAADAGATTSIVKIITTSTAATASVSTSANLPLTNNGATITITAEDASKQAYTVVITTQQQQASDKQLTALTLTINNNDYVAVIDETTKTATLSVPVADAGATTSIVKIITTSTAATASVSTSANLPLTNNSATVTITAEDASKQAYTVVITTQQQQASDKQLTALTLTINNNDYVAAIDEVAKTATFSVPAADAGATTSIVKIITTSTAATASVSTTANLPLTNNGATITITAEDGSQQAYTLVIKSISSDKQLTALTLTINNNDYVAAIDEAAKTATFSVPAADAGATTSIVKIITTSTAATASVSTTANLPLTNNGATITITAEDGSQQAYTLVIKSISSDKQLTALTLTINNNDYVAAIDETAKTATFSVPAADAGATTSIVKIITTSTAATASVSTTANLSLTNNGATITITAEDGSQQAYTLVIKSISSDKQLTALTLTINNNDYVAAIDETAKTATFSVPATDAGATTSIVKIITTSTAATASVSTTANLPLTNNGATITITAEDGSQQAYTLVIKSISSDKQLTALTLTINNNDYVAAIDETAKTATFSVPAADAGATTSIVKIITTSTAATASVSTTANLSLTNNGATITITAEDGSQQAYTLVIKSISSDKQLTALTLTINNNDYVAQIDETAKTASISVFAADAGATTLTVKRSTVSDAAIAALLFSFSNLPLVDRNDVAMFITAEDNSDQRYTIIITKKSSEKQLNTFSISFADNTYYDLDINEADKTITIALASAVVPYSDQGKIIELEYSEKATVKPMNQENELKVNDFIYFVNGESTISIFAEDGTQSNYVISIVDKDATGKILNLGLTVNANTYTDSSVIIDDFKKIITVLVEPGDESANTATISAIEITTGVTAKDNSDMDVSIGSTLTMDDESTVIKLINIATETTTYTINLLNKTAAFEIPKITSISLNFSASIYPVKVVEDSKDDTKGRIEIKATAVSNRLSIKTLTLSKGATSSAYIPYPIAFDGGNPKITVSSFDKSKSRTYEVMLVDFLTGTAHRFEFGGHTYYYLYDAKSWNAAQTSASAIDGGYLVNIDSEEEQGAIEQAIQDSTLGGDITNEELDLQDAQDGVNLNYVWTGGSDDGFNTDDNWYWTKRDNVQIPFGTASQVSEGNILFTPINNAFINFPTSTPPHYSQPNNYRNIQSFIGICVSEIGCPEKRFSWNDLSRNSRFPYIIEIE